MIIDVAVRCMRLKKSMTVKKHDSGFQLCRHRCKACRFRVSSDGAARTGSRSSTSVIVAVSKIAQARLDELLVREAFIDPASDDADLREAVADGTEAFGGGDEVQEEDLVEGDAMLFEDFDGFDHRAPGCCGSIGREISIVASACESEQLA